MAKQNQAAEAKSDKRSRPKVERTVIEELTGDLAALAALAGGPIVAVGDGTIQAQAAGLGDVRLQTVQRQALAAQIGQVQGNQHLQRVIAAVKVTQDPGSIASTGIRGSGSTVPFKSEMEQAFARDFSHVRAHTGTEAHRASKVLGAKAYTLGNDIAFSDSTPDRGTVAHELTHIVQHETSSGVQTNEMTSENAPAEREARATQQATVSGQELPTISETLASSSIAGNWYIRDIDNYWEIQYHMGETAADDLIIAGWVSQRMETPEGEEEFTTEMTPAALGADALVSESGLPPGSLVLSPRQPDEADVFHCIINPRLREDVQAAVRAELLRLDGLQTLVHEGRPRPPAARAAEEEGAEESVAEPSAEQREAMDAFAREEGVDPSRVFWTPAGPRIRLGTVAQEGMDVSEIPPTLTNQQIWQLVRRGNIRGVPITDEIRSTDWYRGLWDREFTIMALSDMIGRAVPQGMPVSGPIGAILDNIITLAGNITTDRPTAVRYLSECRSHTDLVARYYIVLERLGREPSGGWGY